MAIGQSGSLDSGTSAPGQPISVSFDEPLTDPVVALSGTNYGGNKFSFRVLEFQTDANGDATGFTFTLDEWENHDGAHPAVENIHWLAIESGVHTLPDGRIIEAGYADADSDGEAVSLNGNFASAPTILTTVASDNHASHVDSDPFNITADGFDLNVEEAESQDGVHGLENVGWIAIQSGGDGSSGTAQTIDGIDSDWSNDVDFGATYTDAVVLAETQTQNDSDTGNLIFRNIDSDNVDIRFEEDTSVDGDSGHAEETFGLVTFENGVIPCLVKGTRIRTPTGLACVEQLRINDWVSTADNGPQQIRWIGRRHLNDQDLTTHPHLRPVRFLAHSLGRLLPERDLLVSRQHRMFVSSAIARRMFDQDEVLIAAIKLTALPGVFVDETVTSVEYYHLLFDDHQLVFAEGAQTESLYLGTEAQKALSPEASREIEQIFPEIEHLANTKPIRFIPSGRLQKKLIDRHSKNRKDVLI